MPSSRHRWSLGGACALTVMVHAWGASAQSAYPGFALERFYPSPAGAGWFAMDSLDMHGSLGGDFALSFGYAHNPLRITSGTQSLNVVSDQAFVDVGAALTVHRFRFSMNFSSPFAVAGQSGTVGGYTVTDPSVTLSNVPDALSDVRLGVDARLLGGPSSPFRLGAGAQLYVPTGNGTVGDYASDGTFRAMFRVIFAGDVGTFTYAGNVGLHIRPTDDASAPGAPRASELLFGIAAGARMLVGHERRTAVIVGPEVFGATALQSMFGTSTTALEGFLGARVEGTAPHGLQLRFKVGAGGGINPNFGAPEWRTVVGIEVFNRDVRP